MRAGTHHEFYAGG